MPRKARIKSASHIYHVVIRGADRQRFFEESKDYKKYLDFLNFYKEQCDFKIYAYCLMSNHVHLLIYTPKSSIETIFRRLNTSYATWFNMKYTRTGFLQQGRYYSEPVEDFDYLLTVLRYIHQNPFKAGMENYPGASYPWNSIHSYINLSKDCVDKGDIISYFNSIEAFISFNQKTSEDACLDIENIKKRLPDDVAREIIEQQTGCSTVTAFQSLSISDRNKYLIILHKKGLSIRQLNRLTGISKGVIDRAIKNETEGRSA